MRRNNRFDVKRTALCGLLTAMMLVLGFIESMIPVAAGIPGIKLGLSNGVLMFALYMLDAPTAFVLMIVKVVLSGLMFGGVSAMLYAMAGGVLSMITMILLKKLKFHILVVSMFGAVMHNVGQVLMAILIVNTPQLVYYMAVLMLVGLGTGAVTGIAANTTIKHIKKLSK
ncbi:MAG: Gx transporter family protein [Clostridia bacterium]|nr:Gx transporter family protein [Clostridia bacterium]